MFLRVWGLVLKEFIQFLRDRVMTAFILTLPILQLILLAQATGSRISDLCVAVLDFDRSAESRRLVAMLDNQRELNVCHFPKTLEESHFLLDQGEATLAVVIPEGFATHLADAWAEPHVQLAADASNSLPGSIALRAANGAILGFAADRAAERGLTAISPVDLRATVRFNPELNARLFSMPAQVGFIIYQVTLTITSIGLARERELGTLEQLMVVPLRRLELIVGKAIPALIVGTVNFLCLLAITVFAFGVPLQGSLWLLLALTLVFVVAEIGYGFLISSIARTQQQAILLVFVLAMLDMTFSGYMVRIKNLPLALQAIAQVVPFSHYLEIIRGVMLKGAGLDVLWPHAAVMAAIGVLVTIVAVRSLGRSLD
ncbi:MAG: ABC transporter permease [Anaerolineae bacterium]|nr:ABC transporter permease [Anaerolineae bacterium]